MQSLLRNLSISKEKAILSNIFIIKICSIFLLSLISISFGLMPFFINFCRKNNKFLSLSNSFSAGIFLGLAFFHILPEAADIVHKKTEFPLAYVCCFLSYSLNLFIEKVVFSNSHEILHGGLGHHHELEKFEEDEKNEHNEKHKENEDNNENKEEKQVLDIKINQVHNESNKLESKNMFISTNYEIKNTNEEHEEQIPLSKSSSISYLLLLALGFHGLFESISLGIQQTIKGTVFLIIAIALHKWAAALTLGISFVKSGVSQKEYIINILIFSFITPIGISMGMALTSFSSDFIAGIFLSISVGTFIYIACSEIVIHEFNKKENRYIKFLCFILGAGIVLSLNVLEFVSNSGHGHNHSHNE